MRRYGCRWGMHCLQGGRELALPFVRRVRTRCHIGVDSYIGKPVHISMVQRPSSILLGELLYILIGIQVVQAFVRT